MFRLLVDIIRNTDLTEVQFDGFGKPVENGKCKLLICPFDANDMSTYV